jgi:hypothetical protein
MHAIAETRSGGVGCDGISVYPHAYVSLLRRTRALRREGDEREKWCAVG